MDELTENGKKRGVQGNIIGLESQKSYDALQDGNLLNEKWNKRNQKSFERSIPC